MASGGVAVLSLEKQESKEINSHGSVPSSLIAQLFGGAAVATVRRSYPLWGVILARLLGWELAPNNTETKSGYD